MISSEHLDKLLEVADAGYGLAVITDNPQRLRVAFHQRLAVHRKVHPEAYKNLRFLTSRSPRELYIVNAQTTALTRGEQNPPGDNPEGDSGLAVQHLSSERSGEQADPTSNPEPHRTGGENP